MTNLRRGFREYRLTLFLIPAALIYTTFFIWPMINGIAYSLTDWDGFAAERNFIGLQNYSDFLQDERALTATRNTLVYTLFVTTLSNVIGLVLALALVDERRRNRVFRTLIFIPAVLSPVVVSFIWRYMYTPNSGVINSLLRVIGLDGWTRDWLGDPNLALLSVMIVPLWQWGGNVMIVYLAGLVGIPREMYESADMDGASWLRKTWHLTFPMLKPAFVFNIVISTIGSLKTFDFIFILTNGGPGYVSETLTLRVYNYTVYTTQFGYGTAVATVLTLIVVLITTAELRLLRAGRTLYE